MYTSSCQFITTDKKVCRKIKISISDQFYVLDDWCLASRCFYVSIAFFWCTYSKLITDFKRSYRLSSFSFTFIRQRPKITLTYFIKVKFEEKTLKSLINYHFLTDNVIAINYKGFWKDHSSRSIENGDFRDCQIWHLLHLRSDSWCTKNLHQNKNG